MPPEHPLDMNSDTTICVENLGKRFRIPPTEGEQPKGLINLLSTPIRLFREIRSLTKFDEKEDSSVFWALKGIDFEVKRGEILGIIGRNGAGKSTLLKILSRIVAPTTGRIEINGRVTSLLEVGTGFHPDLTGRENIYMNGTLHGMSKREIDKKLDEIIDFSGIERFIDVPIKRYSSGMGVRLGFSVAAFLEPEILILDEVLSVGDVKFQQKCTKKIKETVESGCTVIFVSHNIAAHSVMCDTGLVLDHGRVLFHGGIGGAISSYLRLEEQKTTSFTCATDPERPCDIISGRILKEDGSEGDSYDFNEPIFIEADLEVREPLEGLQFSLAIARNMNEVFRAFDTDGGDPLALKEPGRYRFRYRIPGGILKAGVLHVSFDIGSPSILYQHLPFVMMTTILELSEVTTHRSYRQDRPGEIRAPGAWTIDFLS